MGVGVALRKLFNGILGKKHKNDTNAQYIKEIKLRAQKLGITPEEYIQLTNNNASVWNVGDGDFGTTIDYNLTDDANTIESLRSNVQGRMNNMGINSSQRQAFGLVTDAYERYNSAMHQSVVDDYTAIQENFEGEYEEAVDNADDIEDESDRNNQTAYNFFKQASRGADQDNAQASSALNAANQQADADNNNAATQLNQTKQETDENNADAIKQQEVTETDTQARTDAAETDLQNTETETAQNNQDAKQKTSEAQNNKDQTSQSVTTLETQLNDANKNLQAAKDAINNAGADATQEMQTTFDKAQKNKDELEKKLKEAKEKDETAEKDLTEAKENETKVKDEGQKKVDNANKNLEKTRTEGEKSVESAVKNTEKVQQEGEKKVADATDNKTRVQTQGEKSVKTQEDKLNDVKTRGQEQVKDAQKNVARVEEKGEKEVKKAKKEVEIAKQNNEDAKRNVQEEKYHQESNGVIHENEVNKTATQGKTAKNKAIARAKANNPNASKDLIEQQARVELKKDMMNIDAVRTKGAQQCFKNPPSQETLKAACEARYKQETANGNTTKIAGNEVNLPDGDLNNNVPKQERVGNCWAHSGVTSIAATEEGENMLKSHMYRDESRGVTSIHLQEAQNNGMGAGKSGIYTFTDKEIAEGAKRFGSGDGDVTAYMLATEQYLQEKGENYGGIAASDGNRNSRMYEIITGTSASYTPNDGYVNMGINRFLDDGDFNNKYKYGALCAAVQNGGVAGTLSIAASHSNSHALSIVGVSENGNLLVQEPNNRGVLNEIFTFVDNNGNRVEPFKKTKSINGAPTYELSRDMYNKYIKSGTIYRWR